MALVTVLEKIYGSFSPEEFESAFSALCKGLDVKVSVVDITSRGWIRLQISGEDEKVALRFLEKEIGLAPVHLDNVKKFSIIRGRVLSSNNPLMLPVDVGISVPGIVDAIIPLQRLQSQLADGKKLALKTITGLYALYPKLPLEVKIRKVDAENRNLEAELSEEQISFYNRWLKSGLDRLIILGSTSEHIRYFLKKLGLTREAFGMESLGLLEHVIVCKLGTDAKGLIPKLGPSLPNAVLAPFSPRRIIELISRTAL